MLENFQRGVIWYNLTGLSLSFRLSAENLKEVVYPTMLHKFFPYPAIVLYTWNMHDQLFFMIMCQNEIKTKRKWHTDSCSLAQESNFTTATTANAVTSSAFAVMPFKFGF